MLRGQHGGVLRGHPSSVRGHGQVGWFAYYLVLFYCFVFNKFLLCVKSARLVLWLLFLWLLFLISVRQNFGCHECCLMVRHTLLSTEHAKERLERLSSQHTKERV